MGTVRIIGLAGHKGSGKTFVKEEIADINAGFYLEESFSRPLKELVSSAIPHGLAYQYTCGDGKEDVSPYLGGKSARDLFKQFGDVGRECGLWVSAMRKELEFNTRDSDYKAWNALVIIDDVRYEDEADLIREFGGKVYKIEREGVAQSDEHSSEVIDFEVDGVIRNSEEHLEGDIRGALNDLYGDN